MGPSAGWFLPTAFLERFSRVTCIDLDTSAPGFFHWRHGRRLRRAGTTLRWVTSDFVPCLPAELSLQPDAAVLFCNVLGQLALERPDASAQLAGLPGLLAAHSWASFHDSFSTVHGREPLPAVPAFPSLQPMGPALLQQLGFAGEWVDHGTSTLFPAASARRHISWQISPQRLHWVEAGWVFRQRSL